MRYLIKKTFGHKNLIKDTEANFLQTCMSKPSWFPYNLVVLIVLVFEQINLSLPKNSLNLSQYGIVFSWLTYGLSSVSFPVFCKCVTTVNCFLTNTVSTMKVDYALSLEKVFKNTLKLLEKTEGSWFDLKLGCISFPGRLRPADELSVWKRYHHWFL